MTTKKEFTRGVLSMVTTRRPLWPTATVLDEWDSELSGKKAVDCYRELGRRDPEAVRLIRAVDAYVRSATIVVNGEG